MLYSCTGCGVTYGEGENNKKLKFGFCPGCWGQHLETTRLNARRAYVSWCRFIGVEPQWP